MPLTTTLRLNGSFIYQKALNLQNPVDGSLTYAKTMALTSGIGLNQADKFWSDERTLAPSANENLDLAGSVTDAFGVTLTVVKLKMILIFSLLTNTNNVVVGVGASNGVAGVFGGVSQNVNVLPGGIFLWTAPGAGVTVVAGTGDLLNVANSAGGTSITYDVLFVGTSA